MERAMRTHREVLGAFRDVIRYLGWAHLLALAGVVFRAVVEERALREDLDDRQRGEVVVPDDRDGELAAFYLFLYERALVVLQCQFDSRWQVDGLSDDRRADARPTRDRLNESWDSDRSRGLEILLCRARHDDPARHVEARCREDRLRDLLIHGERRREHARSGVRDADRVEQTLDAPILPPCPMQSDEDDVDRLVVRHHARRWDEGARSALDLLFETPRKLVVALGPAASLDEALRLFALLGRDLRITRHERERVEQDDLEAARIEARRDLRTGRERDVALRRRAAGQHADTNCLAQSLASGQETRSGLAVSLLTAKPLVARPTLLTTRRPARPRERASP